MCVVDFVCVAQRKLYNLTPLGIRIGSGSAVPGPGPRLQVVAVAVKKFLEDRPQGLNWVSKILSRF